MQPGHTEFGQTAYPQQYAFATQMQAMPNNSTHDMNKQIQAQPGMYSTNPSGIPGAQQQHHQQGMGGPAPSPQPSSLVQQGQQMNRQQHMQAAAYYQRSGPGGPSRSMPSMNRNSIPNVNQSGQQPTQQYGQLPPMMGQHAQFHPQMAQMIISQQAQLAQAAQLAQYTPRHQYSQQQPYQVLNHQALYVGPSWNAYNAPSQNTNGYFQPHMPTSYPSIPAQMAPIPAQAPKPEKKILAIIDPETGKNVMEGFENSTGNSSSQPEKEMDTGSDGDRDISCQFATQVAAAAIEDKRVRQESLSKSSSIEDRVNIEEQQPMVLCPDEIDIDEPTEEPGNVEILSNEEPYIDDSIPCSDQSISFYNKENELTSVSDSYVYEAEKPQSDSFEPLPVVEPHSSNDYTIADNLIGYSDSNINVVKPSGVQVVDVAPIPDSKKELDLGKNYDAVEVSVKQVAPQVDVDASVPEIVEQPPISPVQTIAQESKVSHSNGDVPEVAPAPPVAILKPEEKPVLETKKNKARKKRDFSKRAEGGELDAFYVEEDVVETPVPPLPQPVPTAPEVSSFVPEERPPSPVTILDSEILKSIPLPDEVLPPQPNDLSPAEPLSESSLSPSAETEDKENNVDDATNKIILKYSYKEDQWSPLNPEGKKQYDRDFLLRLQSQPMSMRKPSNLPNLDVIKDKAHIQRLNEVNRQIQQVSAPLRTYNDPFMPMYARGGGGGPAGIRPPHPLIGRRSQQGRDKPKKVISFSSSLNQAVKLHESENAWKPSVKVETADDADNQELHKKVRGILNKLTPQKFSTLVEQVKNLEINNEDRLNSVIDLVFEKAIDEPNFSVPYANMCKHLALIQVPSSGQQGQFVNFRKLLLTKCQKEFEQDRCDELKREEQKKAIEGAENEDKRKVLQLEFDEEEKKTRYRQLGNIRFIGELFKLGMLIEPIMYECIKKLLQQGDEESLECLCRLLKTIGKELDGSKKEQKNNVMECCFNDMQKIVEKRFTSSRVRFMLQDVIDLKRNNWIPRRDENNPKTIDQIHEDAEREAHEQQQILQNVSYAKRMPDDRDRRKGNTGRGVSEDGWTPSKSNKGSYSVVDPSKLKLTKPAEVESIHLGPGGRGLSSWAKGSSGGTKSNSGDSDSRSMLTNRYSALADQSMTSAGFEGRRGAQRSAASSRESSRGRNNQLPPPVRKTPSISKERENLLETVKGMSRGTTAEQKTPEVIKAPETHVNGKDNSAVALKGSDLSEEEVEKRVKPLIDEFVHNADSEEAIKCIMELASPSTIHLFISGAVNQVLERSSQARCLLGQLLYSMLEKKLITLDQFKKGFTSVLEFIDDYALDIPLIWDYLGEILEAMINDPWCPYPFVKDILKPIMPSLNSGKLMCAVLHCAVKKRGTIKVADEWRASCIDWSEFLGSTIEVSDFIKSNKLEFIIQDEPKKEPKIEKNMVEIKKNLDFHLKNSEENEPVFDWIEGNVPNQLTEPSFIRALVTAVHENAITNLEGNYVLDQQKLKKRICLLTRYIDHNDDLELQALYAVQALFSQYNQPKNMLKQIFDILYDDDVTGEVAFKRWEKSTDPAEQDGKGVALASVGPFLTWLREADEESADADDETDED